MGVVKLLAMAAISSPKALLLLLFLSTCSSSLSSPVSKLGFSVEIIHRDSPLSPLYSPNATALHRWNSAYRRSTSRLHHLRSIATTRTSDSRIDTGTPAIAGSGEYLMRYELGSSHTVVHAVIDTASTLIWTQCQPCNRCYTQKDPIFNPSSSSSFQTIPCKTAACKVLEPRSRCAANACAYMMPYTMPYATDADSKIGFSEGVLAEDDFTVASVAGDKKVRFPTIVFGCGHNNSFDFPDDMDGFVGLGLGGLSLVTQIGPQIGWKFSYCLRPFENHEEPDRERMFFGDDAKLLGRGTSLAVPKEKTSLYYLTLEDISVGAERLRIPRGMFERDTATGSGGFVIDSATTFTFLKRAAYTMLEHRLREVIKLPSVAGGLWPCFRGTKDDLEEQRVPVITFHFRELDVPLKPRTGFMEVMVGVVCLMVMPSDGLSIFGNLAQRDLHVGFQAHEGRVYMAPGNCGTDS